MLLVAAAFPTAAAGRAASVDARLTLPNGWYRIVAPYRYDVEHRFEAGQRRGAGVLPAAGVIRSPVSGRVRFSGSVAGRSVTTIATRLRGTPVVVTVTGGAGRTLRPGDHVRVGDVLGTGMRVHVGAYDARQRFRYLPVDTTGVTVANPTSAATQPKADVPAPRHPVSETILRRLVQAVDGVAVVGSGAAPRAPVPGASSAPPPNEPGTRTSGQPRRSDRTAAFMPVLPPGLGTFAPARPAASRAPTRAPRSGPSDVPSPRRSRRRDDAGGGGSVGGVGHAMSHEAAHAMTGGMPPGTGSTTRGAPRPSRSPATIVTARTRAQDGGAQVGGERHGGEQDGMGADAPAVIGSDPRVTTRDVRDQPWRRTWLLVALVLCVTACVGGVLQLRRRSSLTGDGALVLPPPVRIPRVECSAYPVPDTEGAAVLPDVGVAWHDPDAGTCTQPDPPASAPERTPEHA